MFKRLDKLVKNVKSLDQEIIFLKIVNSQKVKQFIIDLNTFDQILTDGVNSKGETLPGYKYDYFEEITYTSFGGKTITKDKQRGAPYLLVDSNKMFQSFNIQVDGDGFVIDAETIKTDDLPDGGTSSFNYQDLDILGLTNESKNKLVQEILPMVRQEVRGVLLS